MFVSYPYLGVPFNAGFVTMPSGEYVRVVSVSRRSV